MRKAGFSSDLYSHFLFLLKFSAPFCAKLRKIPNIRSTFNWVFLLFLLTPIYRVFCTHSNLFSLLDKKFISFIIYRTLDNIKKMAKTSKKRVIIGMSGGVKTHNNLSLKTKCCSVESQRNAEKIADYLDIPFFVVNYSDYFKKNIVDNYISTFIEGKTPNPCARCNMFIKFGLMLEAMKEHNADFVATGHYCQKTTSEDGYKITKGEDPKKDQTYFLYHLTQDKLKHILWPIGEFTKKDIYEKAKELNLPVEFESESQDVCFIPDKDPKDFLRRHIPEKYLKPGPIITVDGEILDIKHKGLPLYTIGQRKGIDVGGLEEALYVVKLDHENNALIVGHEDALNNSGLIADKINIISGEKLEGKQAFDIKVRYSTQTYPATVEINDNIATVMFDSPMRAITPGQIVSFYDSNELIGGGVIRDVIK